MSKLEFSPELLEALQKLSSLLESDDALDRTLHSVAELAVGTLPGCDSAGVMLRIDGKHLTAAASDAYALEMDKIQCESGEGPCVSALEKGVFEHIDAVSEETRWPEFCRRTAEKGFRSGISFPLKPNGSVGALNLYSKTERAFDERSKDIGEVFARQATIALANAHTYVAARKLADQLNEALQSRDTIGRAKGILMEREGVSDAEAFVMLTNMSQNTNVKLRDVAQRLVEERTQRDVTLARGTKHC